MGFTVEELARGVEILLRRLGVEPAIVREGELVMLSGLEGVSVEIAPMPEERIRYPVLFPRTLLRLRGAAGPVEHLNQKILLYFLRVTG